MPRSFWILVLVVVLCTGASAQQLELRRDALKDDASQAITELAKQAIAVYQEPDRARYLTTLFRLQIVAGQYQEGTVSPKL